jgi:hypothetical protein
MSEETSITKESFHEALTAVVTSIADRADAEMQKEKPWAELWEASEGGLRSLLSEADHQMKGPVFALCDIIKKRFGIKKISGKLYDLFKALPFAMWEVREHISNTQGMSCCADKAREAYYQEVLEEINRIKGEENGG